MKTHKPSNRMDMRPLDTIAGLHPYHARNTCDWQTSEDYDPPGAEWHGVDVLGGDYQVQIDMNRAGHYRHRSYDHGAWKEGPAPE